MTVIGKHTGCFSLCFHSTLSGQAILSMSMYLQLMIEKIVKHLKIHTLTEKTGFCIKIEAVITS